MTKFEWLRTVRVSNLTVSPTTADPILRVYYLLKNSNSSSCIYDYKFEYNELEIRKEKCTAKNNMIANLSNYKFLEKLMVQLEISASKNGVHNTAPLTQPLQFYFVFQGPN